MRKLQNSGYYPLALYSFALLAALLCINYFDYLFWHASGIHFWRQVDSLSFVAHYYDNGLDFFEPGTMSMTATNTRAASEFPIIYYITAALWHVFGRHEYILKIIDSLIVFTGFYCLFKIAIQQIGNIYTALATTLLLLSSTTLLYYTNNFIPDPPALGLCFIGAYLFFKFISTQQYKYYLWAYVVFTLCVVIKVSMGVFPLAVVGLFVLEKLFKLKLQNTPIFAGNPVKYIAPPLLMVILTTAWVLWAKHYNQVNYSYLFLTEIQPIWQANAYQLAMAKEALLHKWHAHYYYYSAWHVFYVLLIGGIVAFKKWTTTNLWLSFMLIAGTVAYILFFYKQFEAHDYYILPAIVPLAFTVIFSLGALNNKFPKLKTSPLPVFVLFVIVGLSYNYTRHKTADRIDFGKWGDINPEIFEISGKLESYGIPKDAAIISFPDKTPNGSLYYLQRKGFTNAAGHPVKATAKDIARFIPFGIPYMVISHPAYYQFAQSSWYSTVEVGRYKNIRMYKFTRVDAAP